MSNSISCDRPTSFSEKVSSTVAASRSQMGVAGSLTSSEDVRCACWQGEDAAASSVYASSGHEDPIRSCPMACSRAAALACSSWSNVRRRAVSTRSCLKAEQASSRSACRVSSCPNLT
eukprot:scaffold133766_cov38-Tisochrysis_lutea.AAC.2